MAYAFSALSSKPIMGDIAELLLDVTDYFTFSRAERVATLIEQCHQVVSEITTS